MFLPEPYVHEPGKHTRDQKDNNQKEVNAFDLLLIDHIQEVVMTEMGFLPQDAKHVVHFEYGDA